MPTNSELHRRRRRQGRNLTCHRGRQEVDGHAGGDTVWRCEHTDHNLLGREALPCHAPEVDVTVGVIGVGSQLAVVHLERDIIVNAARQHKPGVDDDLPNITTWNVARGRGRTNDIEHLREAARMVEHAGVSVAAICSASAHQHLPELRKDARFDIVDIVAATAAVTLTMTAGTVGLIATQDIIDTGLYHRRLEGVDIIELDPERIEPLIAAARAANPKPDQMQRLVDELFDAGADTVVLGCEQLTVHARHNSLRHRDDVIDFVDVAADTLCRRWRQQRRQQQRQHTAGSPQPAGVRVTAASPPPHAPAMSGSTPSPLPQIELPAPLPLPVSVTRRHISYLVADGSIDETDNS